MPGRTGLCVKESKNPPPAILRDRYTPLSRACPDAYREGVALIKALHSVRHRLNTWYFVLCTLYTFQLLQSLIDRSAHLVTKVKTIRVWGTDRADLGHKHRH